MQHLIMSESDSEDVTLELKRHPTTGKIYEVRLRIITDDKAADLGLQMVDLRVLSSICEILADEWQSEKWKT